MATRPDDVEALYLEERAAVARATTRIAGDSAEDLVHDAFLTFLTHQGHVAHPRAWLTTVARNRALNILRRRREVVLDRDVEAEHDPYPSERDALRSLVATALGDIDERSLAALRLRFFEERPTEEIAEAIGVHARQIPVIVHRALRRLGRAIVHRLAEAHDAGACRPALEAMAGLGARTDGHGPTACDRCAPVVDELAALRSLGLVPAAAGAPWLHRVLTALGARGPVASDALGRAANMVTAIGIAATAIIAPPAADARPVLPDSERAPRQESTARPERRAPTRANTAPAPARTTPRAVDEPSRERVAETGPIVIERDDRHTHGEVNGEDGETAGGVVVCEPLQPCPPPPGP